MRKRSGDLNEELKRLRIVKATVFDVMKVAKDNKDLYDLIKSTGKVRESNSSVKVDSLKQLSASGNSSKTLSQE